MERNRGPSLASPTHDINKPVATASRQRKRLQKGAPKQKGSSLLGRRTNDNSRGNNVDSASKLAAHPSGASGQPSLPLPPDLSDSKWLEYIRGSGFLCAGDLSARPVEPLNAPVAVAIVPEFSHLAVEDAQPPRPSLDSSMSTDSPSSTSTASTMRRRAKTPVFAVGQLEGFAFGRDAAVADKTSSVDLIAAQYQALLGSRDRDSIYSDAHSEPSPSRYESGDDELELRRQCSVEELPSITPFHSSPVLANLALSPTSDDGTLVAFDEEAVYFKPISFSPAPSSPSRSSPLRSYDSAAQSPRSPQVLPDNLSLQICLDLLTRELSSAMSGRPDRVGTDASALQVWVMIEAYERLRDLVMDMRLRHGGDQMTGVEMMFDTWLQALYSIHDSLAGEGRHLECDYETVELGEPLD